MRFFLPSLSRARRPIQEDLLSNGNDHEGKRMAVPSHEHHSFCSTVHDEQGIIASVVRYLICYWTCRVIAYSSLRFSTGFIADVLRDCNNTTISVMASEIAVATTNTSRLISVCNE